MSNSSRWIIFASVGLGMVLFLFLTMPFAAWADPAPTLITISLQAQPTSRQDFRFHGDLGDFSLDQAMPDDGDSITQTLTFTVSPGVYQITEETPITWHLSQIDCSLAEQAQIQLVTGTATLTVEEGQQMHCIFVNQRGVTIRTRSYHDHNGDRAHTLAESYQSNWTMTLYRNLNIVIGSQVTNHYGKANFNYLLPGEYTLCQQIQQSWNNSQPGLVDAAYSTPCYTFTLQPGELTILWFGNQQSSDLVPESTPTIPRAITIVQGADVAADDSGYDEWEFVDSDMNQDDRGPTIFMPLVLTLLQIIDRQTEAVL